MPRPARRFLISRARLARLRPLASGLTRALPRLPSRALPLLLAGCAAAGGGPARRPDPPPLLVLVSVDQCRADYVSRFLPALAPGGGWRRLLDGGAVYEHAAHTHTVTSTGPAHAALSTGCLPARAGIPENEWIDPATGTRVYCVADPAGGMSTAHLQRPTLGDALQAWYGAPSRVVSVSFKDRTALLLGGRVADACAWIDTSTGRWTARTHPPGGRPAWLDALDGGAQGPGPFLLRPETAWERAVPEALAARLAGPDDAPGEDRDGRLGATFPHRFPGPDASTEERVHARAVSPLCDAVVVQAALAAVRAEGLGRDAVPDLLCVGLSGMDHVGHAFGPDSVEVLEAFVALDRQLAVLMDGLDRHAGRGRWVLALTSDHGLAPVPEQSGGLRIVRGTLERELEQALVARYGPPPAGAAEAEARWLHGIAKPSVYLDHARARAAGLEPEALVAELARELARRPGVAGAWTRAELASGAPSPSPGPSPGVAPGVAPADVAALARDVHPTRSGDVFFLLTENTVFTGAVATDHGSHHAYDRAVPLVLLGRGIAPGRHARPVAPLDLVPTLARLAGLPPLADVDGRPLHEVLPRPAPEPAPEAGPEPEPAREPGREPEPPPPPGPPEPSSTPGP